MRRDRRVDKVEIISVAHHRNGVAGCPFRVVLFRDPEGVPGETMVAVQMCTGPDQYGGGDCRTAALSVDRLAEGGPNAIAFGHNSWRGDEYQVAIEEALARIPEPQVPR